MSQPEDNVVVLVADDEPSTLALVASHVRSKGHQVFEASDGDQAWQLAYEQLPDLVVLDVMMPGMSGWEVCRKIREAVSLAHTGVIMLTGIGENLNEMTSPLYGADAYLDKPFEFTDLDAKVAAVLAARRRGSTMGRPDADNGRAVPVLNGSNGASFQPTLAKAPPKKAPRKVVAKGSPAASAKSAGSVEKAKMKTPKAPAAKTVAKPAKAAKSASSAKKSASKPAKAVAKKPVKAVKVVAKPAKAVSAKAPAGKSAKAKPKALVAKAIKKPSAKAKASAPAKRATASSKAAPKKAPKNPAPAISKASPANQKRSAPTKAKRGSPSRSRTTDDFSA